MVRTYVGDARTPPPPPQANLYQWMNDLHCLRCTRDSTDTRCEQRVEHILQFVEHSYFTPAIPHLYVLYSVYSLIETQRHVCACLVYVSVTYGSGRGQEAAYWADGDELVGVVHHGDEQVEQHDDVDHGEWAEHEEAGKTCKFLDASQFEIVQVYETENGPE